MEILCTRCHQAVEAENCYCPTCGLPQLQYSAENVPGQVPAERWTEPIRDASIVDWKRALPLIVMVGAPAGVLCPLLSPLGLLGPFLMAIASYGAVMFYLRTERPGWITTGAGARIGLVIGLFGCWISAAAIGTGLFVLRFVTNQGRMLDDGWQTVVIDPAVKQWTAGGMDSQTVAACKAWLCSPEGRGGFALAMDLLLAIMLIIFAVCGGALSARLQARVRSRQA